MVINIYLVLTLGGGQGGDIADVLRRIIEWYFRREGEMTTELAGELCGHLVSAGFRRSLHTTVGTPLDSRWSTVEGVVAICLGATPGDPVDMKECLSRMQGFEEGLPWRHALSSSASVVIALRSPLASRRCDCSFPTPSPGNSRRSLTGSSEAHFS